MNYRAILIACLATLLLAVTGWGQADGKIAFISHRDGYDDVWIMNADGSDPVNLTQGRDCASPAWSPDGTKIAYIGDVFDDDQYGGEIWLMDADGGNPQQLTDDSVDKTSLSWSADGNSIYYIVAWETENLDLDDRMDGPNAFVMALNGRGSSVDWREVPHRYPYSRSPDGTKEAIVVLKEKGDEENLVRLYVRDANEDEFIAWATGEHPSIPLPVLGLSRNAIVSDLTWVAEPTWAPDSIRIAFATRTSPRLIWAVDINGGNLVELTNGLGGHSPAWQPVFPAATSVEAQSWGRIKSLLSTGTR